MYQNGFSSVILEERPFTPELYYSFLIYKNNKFNQQLSNLNSEILLLCDNFVNINIFQNYNLKISHIFGTLEIPVQINGNNYDPSYSIRYINNCKINFPLRIHTPFKLFNIEFLDSCTLFLSSNDSINDIFNLPFINHSSIIDHCNFNNISVFYNIPNLLLYQCNFNILPSISINNIGYNLCQINTSIFEETEFKYQQKYSISLINNLNIRWSNPQLLYIQDKWYIFIKNINPQKSLKLPINYCISPGISFSSKYIDLYPFLSKGKDKLLIVIPHGIYILSKSINIYSHLIGIGKPIIILNPNVTIRLLKDNIIISDLYFKYSNIDMPILDIRNSFINLFNIHISYFNNNEKNIDMNCTSDSSLIYLRGNDCQCISFFIESDYSQIFLIESNNNIFNDIIIESKKSNLLMNILGMNCIISFFYGKIYHNTQTCIKSIYPINIISSGFYVPQNITKRECLTIHPHSIIKHSYFIYFPINTLEDLERDEFLKQKFFPYFFSQKNQDNSHFISNKSSNSNSSVIFDNKSMKFFLIHSKSQYLS